MRSCHGISLLWVLLSLVLLLSIQPLLWISYLWEDGRVSPQCLDSSDQEQVAEQAYANTRGRAVQTQSRCTRIYPLGFDELEEAFPQLRECIVTTHAMIVQNELEKSTCLARTASEADVISMPPYLLTNCNWPNYSGGNCEADGNSVRLGEFRRKFCTHEVLAVAKQVLLEEGRGKQMLLVDDAGGAPDIRTPTGKFACCKYFNTSQREWKGQPCLHTYHFPGHEYVRPEFIWAKRASQWTYYRRGIDIALPPPSYESAQWPPAKGPLKHRQLFAMFKGTFGMHNIRFYAHELFHGKTYEGKKVVIAERNSDFFQNDYKEMLHNTIFALLLRGDTRDTHRFNDVVCSGAVPVLVTDTMVPPFDEITQFESYGVVVWERQLEEMMDILQHISDQERERLRRASLKACADHFQTAGRQASSLVKILETRMPQMPLLVEGEDSETRLP